MSDFKENFSTLKENYKQLSRKDKIISFAVFAAVLFIVYRFGSNAAIQTMGIADVIILAVLLSTVMLIVGFIVVKSLFLLAAELSLLILLAQSLCSVPGHSIASNEAMKNLLIIGFLYVIIKFFHSLSTDLKEYYKKIEHEKKSTPKILLIFLFVIFVLWFLWEIYQVINPIIRNLCIYH